MMCQVSEDFSRIGAIQQQVFLFDLGYFYLSKAKNIAYFK